VVSRYVVACIVVGVFIADFAMETVSQYFDHSGMMQNEPIPDHMNRPKFAANMDEQH
jgi:hypothetical protein